MTALSAFSGIPAGVSEDTGDVSIEVGRQLGGF
jgi:hypothetical protein